MSPPLTPRAAFRRRLALLMLAFLVAAGAMAAQMVRLGVADADHALAEAERRLSRERWIPTVRGRILDRNGRILAQNRPTYEVAIDYRVLSGEWAATHARRHARRAHAKAWPILTEAQREEVVARFEPLYTRHVAAMERRVQTTLGIAPQEFADRKQRILDRVRRTAGSVAEFRLDRSKREQLERGRWLTPEIYAILQERAAAPIAAQREPHVVGDAADDTAFALIRLQDATAQIAPPDAGRGSPDAGRGFPNAGPDAQADPVGAAEEVPLLPGLVVRRSEERQYPYDHARVTLARDSLPTPLRSDEPVTLELEGVAAHLIGWMGSRPLESDVARRAALLEADPDFAARALVNTLDRQGPDARIDRGQYKDGDPVARAGVEWSREADLRGFRGLRTERLDTGQAQTIPPEPGGDVTLTLDIHLQARVQAILDPRFGLTQTQPYHSAAPGSLPIGTPLNSAAVVIDVDSGDVLAMVTSPSFSRDDLKDNPKALFEDALNTPLVNRAIAKPYPPGSVLKALILCGAVTHGHYTLGQRIRCRGYLLPDNDKVLRCWIYREVYGYSNHSIRFGRDLDAVDALTASCNIFFYTMGRRMGASAIADTLRTFGVGTRFNLGVGAEFPGSIGTIQTVTDEDGNPTNIYTNDGAGLTEFDATIMGIGQGPIAWTPLHAANAYTTLARMGVAITPRVIDDGSAPKSRETSLDRRAIVAALEGLDGVVNNPDNGTAHHLTFDTGREPIFNTPGVHVWGKSSTAQAPPLFLDNPARDAEGNRIPIRSGDHAWFTALVGREGERPRYAISVIVEYGGSGGRVGGPIVNQIIRALVDEGYL
ncbi:MAG: penicillin-binding transpeptidase domain-containing protein [Planctomycetota bacterium]|nr:penicillin-binding transpeptidase domain-containing protein [Planctomycetota bacterium]